MSAVRVVVADDFPLVRLAITDALGADERIEVVGEAATGTDAVELVRELAPDVLLLDVHMPELSGLSALEQVRAASPATRVVMLTATEKQDVFLQAVAAGAAGYLNKRIGMRELVQAVLTVHAGGSVLPPGLAGALMQQYASEHNLGGGAAGGGAGSVLLGEQEQEVLRLVALGCTDREIGQQLFVSPRTVQNCLARIRRKTGARRRSELARWAADHARV